jgi:hypothetical protein
MTIVERPTSLNATNSSCSAARRASASTPALAGGRAVCEALTMLLFDGLHCFGNRSICRIRVVSAAGETPRIVIATHLADSPGASISNDFERLVASVCADFGEQPTRWLLHFPEPEEPPGPDELTWIEGIPDDDEPRWLRLSRTDAEALTGLDLCSAETEASTVDALAGDRGLLRSLARAPEPERRPGEYLRVVPVTALPFAYGPFRSPTRRALRSSPEATKGQIAPWSELTGISPSRQNSSRSARSMRGTGAPSLRRASTSWSRSRWRAPTTMLRRHARHRLSQRRMLNGSGVSLRNQSTGRQAHRRSRTGSTAHALCVPLAQSAA